MCVALPSSVLFVMETVLVVMESTALELMSSARNGQSVQPDVTTNV